MQKINSANFFLRIAINTPPLDNVIYGQLHGKGKERKALEKQIQKTEAELDEKLDKLPDILTDDGYLMYRHL